MDRLTRQTVSLLKNNHRPPTENPPPPGKNTSAFMGLKTHTHNITFNAKVSTALFVVTKTFKT